MCDSGQVYDSCGSPVEPTCDNLHTGYTTARSGGVTVEGCFCPPGTVRNGKHSDIYTTSMVSLVVASSEVIYVRPTVNTVFID